MSRRDLHLTRASDIPTTAWRTNRRALIDAIHDVLPDEWQLLPDGRSTASVIASRAHADDTH